jgi:hypothetical protein
MESLIQVLGALCVLIAYALAQFRRLDSRSFFYLFLNFIGSATLAVLAATDRQWGFLLLEGVWAFISLWGIRPALVRRRSGSSPPP